MGLQFVVLGLLSEQPNSGYGIARTLRQSLSHIWGARIQQVYSELGHANEQGLVLATLTELRNRPAKKIYTLTGAGEEALDSWLNNSANSFTVRDDLQIKLHCLERIPRDLLLGQLASHRERFAREIERLRTRLVQVSGANAGRLGQMLTLEAALARAEAEVSWCDKALGALRVGAAEDRSASRFGKRAAGG